MFFLTRLAAARRSVTILIALAVFGGGVASWGNLKQELLPNIDFPIVTVILILINVAVFLPCLANLAVAVQERR